MTGVRWARVGSVAALVAAMFVGTGVTGASAAPGEPVAQAAGRVEAQAVPAGEHQVDLEITPSGVGPGSPVTVRWEITGGVEPRIESLRVRSELVSGSLVFTGLVWGTYQPSSAGRAGSQTVTSGAGDWGYLEVTVIDEGVEVTYESERWWVGPSSVPYRELGTVTDTRTGESGAAWVVDGVLLRGGWSRVGDAWIHANEQGFFKRGWARISGAWYWFSPESGQMMTGWRKDSGSWYYLTSSGAMATGWAKVDGRWYLFDRDGARRSGWVRDGGSWYNLRRDDGAMLASTWVTEPDGGMYYLRADGRMCTGWCVVGGVWYFMDGSGRGWQGWLQQGRDWYFLGQLGSSGSPGYMHTGWVSVGGSWYYLEESGRMRTGWLQSGRFWYYLKADGVMATGATWIDGRLNYFSEGGVWSWSR